MRLEERDGGSPDLPQRGIRMTLAYDGTGYLGWQTQPSGRAVQDVVEARLARILDHPVRVHGAGRTDRGVHARGQVASFSTHSRLAIDRLLAGVNSLLPPDIAVMRLGESRREFHARHAARAREYAYRVWNAPARSPFEARFTHHVRRALDVVGMQEAAGRLVGRWDFTSFCAAESAGGRMERVVTLSTWERRGSLLVYRVRADSFLHRMVRNLVGTMLEVGAGRRAPADLAAILAARDRRAAGATAPARGLCLDRVFYDEAETERQACVGWEEEAP